MANTIALYTPGHNVFTDTLIMHGLVRVLSWIGITKGEVERIGERYEVKVETSNDISKLLHETIENLKVKSIEDLRIALNTYSALNRADLPSVVKKLPSVVKKLHDIRSFNPPATEQWPITLSEGLRKLNLTPYTTVDHINQEGRKKKGETTYLPLGPIYGKYVIEGYTIEKTKKAYYFICLNCFTLGTLGLIYGTGLVSLEIEQREKGKRNYYYYYVTIAPTKATFDEIILFQKGIEELYISLKGGGRWRRYVAQEVTGLAAMLYLFSYGETVSLFDYPVDILMWGIERGRRGTIRVVELTQVTGKKLLEAVARIKYRIPEWPRIAKTIITKDPTLLHAIAESVIFGTDPYIVIREYRRLADEISREGEKEVAKLMKKYGADLAEVLLELSV
ncbi:MAG: hypothetical protein QW794_07005 [Thermosphaera sp.]